MTHDGGSHWNPTSPIPDAANPGPQAADAFVLDARLAWAWVAGSLYPTVDGGGHWRMTAHGLALGDTPEIQFVTSSIGFSLPMRSVSLPRGQTYILETRDGGRTWVKVRTMLIG